MSNVASAQQEWLELAKLVGYESEKEMWQGLYVEEGRSINELSKTLGFGTATIQRRLRLAEIDRKARGGANMPSKVHEKLFHMDQREVRMLDSSTLAKMCDSSTHSIYRVRREM